MKKDVTPLEKFWLVQQFEQINKKLDLLLIRVQKLQDTISSPNPNVIPALEEAIKKVGLKAVSIDIKVPDSQKPPDISTDPPKPPQ